MDGSGGAVIQIGLLVGFIVASLGRDRWPAIERHFKAIVGTLAAIGLLSYVGSVRVDPISHRVHIHHADVYHYYVGAKYFAELGQTGLYEATVVADFEDDPDHFRPAMAIRDLRDTSREITRKSVLQRRDEIKRRFSRARWREFKSDLAFFRNADPARWRRSEIQRDHGYNGTPMTTAVIGALANWNPGGTARFVTVAVWLDLALVLTTGILIGALLGRYAGAVFLLFWFVNPLNDYSFTGGGLLRYNYFIATALGVAFYRRGWIAASGVGLAMASLFRIFPLLFPVALLGCDLLHSERRRRLRRNLRFYVATAVTLAVLLAATSFVPTPSGDNAWVEQLEAVSARNALQAPNGVSLRFPFLYRAEHDVSAVMSAAARGETLDWLAETNRTFASRRPYYYAALAGCVALAIGFARRSRDVESFFLGIFGIFSVLIVSHYDYCLLSVVPLMFCEQRRVTEVLAIGMAAIAATGWLPGVDTAIDLHFAIVSGIVLATLIAIVWLRLWDPKGEGGEAVSSA